MIPMTKRQKATLLAMRISAAFFIVFGLIMMLVTIYGIGFVGLGGVIIILSFGLQGDYEYDNEQAAKRREEREAAMAAMQAKSETE